MILVAYVPLIVAVVGALVYGLSSGKASELGKIAFFVGLLVLIFSLASHVVRFP